MKDFIKFLLPPWKTWTCLKYYFQLYFYIFILNKYTCATPKEVQFKFFFVISRLFHLRTGKLLFTFSCLKNTTLVQYIDKPLTQLSILALMSPAGPLHSGEKRFMKLHLAFSKGQLILKVNFKVFIWIKKTTKKYFCISALASKNP